MNMDTLTVAIEPSANEKTDKRSTLKLDTIRNIEREMQRNWADLKVFEADPPTNWNDK